MKRSFVLSALFVAFTVSSSAATLSYAQTAPAPAPASVAATTTETIVILRHGEKPRSEIGQLNDQGLNRSLALPAVLQKKFGAPTAIFAPDPGKEITNRKSGESYSYIRPLETIEPTAISLDMPVNAEYGFEDIKGLQSAITAPAYSGALLFVCWEHLKADDLAKNLMASNHGDPGAIPYWPDNDYDSLYIIRISHSPSGTVTVTFTHDTEGLNGEPVTYPAVTPGVPAAPAAPSSGQ